jgi:dihydrodipicolinate synthase/N-acetylneuraminate lyase
VPPRRSAAERIRAQIDALFASQQDLGEVLEEVARLRVRLGDGSVGQLPREVEALHKFQVGPGADERATNALLDGGDAAASAVRLVAIRPLSQHWLLANPLAARELSDLLSRIRRAQDGFRVVRHASGVVLVFDKPRSHVTLLTADEWATFAATLPRAGAFSATTTSHDGGR